MGENTLEKRNKVYIETFGCQMNVYDSNKMADVLHSSCGFEKTDCPEIADLLLVNTCSVREKAAEKLFSLLGRWRQYKTENPHVLIGVGGCVASQEGADILARAPFVDMVFGPQTLHRLPAMIENRRRAKKPQIDISFPQIEKFDSLPPSRNNGVAAFVTIMEGCSHYCSFCVVPYTRGEEISRPLEDVLVEISELGLQGVKEITLLGQNVNAYESILDGQRVSFADLLALVSDISGIERIRFTTSHPLGCTDDLIELFQSNKKLAPHIHLPAQSGSDRILALMKRGYTRKDYLDIVAKLRQARPEIVISSDFIVGFPTEREEDFLETLLLVDEVGFGQSYSFLYSPRPGTPAAAMVDTTPKEKKLERLHRLQERLQCWHEKHLQAQLGQVHPILVEEVSKREEQALSGWTPQHHKVNFLGHRRLIGHMVDVVITDYRANTLRGEIKAA